MQKLETRNGTLLFVEVSEIVHSISFDKNFFILYYDNLEEDIETRYDAGSETHELLGEVTKEGITFDCEPFVGGHFTNGSKTDGMCLLLSDMQSQGIELTEGNKFVVLKERKA